MLYHRFANLGQKFNSNLTGKVMKGIFDSDLMDMKCNCNKASTLENGKCMYDSQCRQSMVVYELQHKATNKSYIGKTQCHLKTRTKQHVYNAWKVIKTGRQKFGENWYGSGSYARADAFSKHFSNLCRDCSSSNKVQVKMKKIIFLQFSGKQIGFVA